MEIARYIEDVEAAKAARLSNGVTPDPLKVTAKGSPAAHNVRKGETTSSARANLTSPPGTTKGSTNRGDFDIDFDLEFEDLPQAPFNKPGTAQSNSRSFEAFPPRRLSAAEAFDVMQSFVFDFNDEIPEAPPPVVPVAITDAIETHSFGEFTPIDIGLRDVEDDAVVQVHWIPITVHGLWISVGFLLIIVLLAMGNFYLTTSLRSVGKCTSEKGSISFGNLLTVVLICDVFVFQSAFIGSVWFFRAMTSGEEDAYWSELHPYDGEWRVAKTQSLAMMLPLDLEAGSNR